MNTTNKITELIGHTSNDNSKASSIIRAFC